MKNKLTVLTLLTLISTMMIAVPIILANTNPSEQCTILGGNFAEVANAKSTGIEHYFGSGSWQNIPNAKMELYIDPTVFDIDPFTIAEIESISYVTKVEHCVNPETAPVDFSLNIYTMPYTGGDSTWYGNRLSAEPMYSYSYNQTTNEWNVWRTDEGDNQLQFYDSNHGPAGFYTGPTIADIKVNPINWTDWVPSGVPADDTPIYYYNQTVKYIALVTSTGGNWKDFIGYLDAITIELTTETITIDLEDYPNQVWVDDYWAGKPLGTEVETGKYIGYNASATIQEAINAVAIDGTVYVAAGTYEEDITVDKSLTLNGTQAGVDARGRRTGAESEIVGSIYVNSDATNVTIDGFKITGTETGAIGGACIIIESPSSTVKNNVFVAVESGRWTQPGITSFVGITNTVVEYNAFSGAYDASREPNVILLGITGAGNATVANNEMLDVGGGGGIGVMCANDTAVINIEGNEIDNTGDGVWVWNAPETTFDTLSIAYNNIHDCAKKGVKVVGTVEGSIIIHYNNIYDNTEEGVYNGVEDLTINATLNWWGHKNGPSTDYVTAGDRVSANVTYVPWLDAPHPGGTPVPYKTETVTNDILDAKTEADTEVVVTGTATVTVAEYPSNPGNIFEGDIGKCIDVHINTTEDVTELEVRLYYTEAEIADLDESSLKMHWWNGAAWVLCSDTGVNTTGTGGYSGYIWAHINAATTPSLSDLVGTPFGAAGTPPPVEAGVSIHPETLNLKSKGKWITAFIKLPEGYDVTDIDVESVKLNQSISAEWGNVEDGVLMVKFSRAGVIKLLDGATRNVELTITVEVNGFTFEAYDTIRVISPGRK